MQSSVLATLTNTSDDKIDNTEIKDSTKNNSTDLTNYKNNTSEGFCYYLGLLILFPYLKKIVGIGKQNLLQWIVGLYIGAKNIEQSKVLNFTSLNNIIGTTTRNLNIQRTSLKSQVTVESIRQLQEFNMELVGVKNHTDFYYDPHTKHYTGLKKILKGWCSRTRFADKVINMDFIHTTSGYPVYVDNTDNYDDLRIRFFHNIKRFREISHIKSDQILTFIIDRAIFSHEVFKQIINSPNTHLITWEKNYKKTQWDDTITNKTGNLVRYRNNAFDFKIIKYEYQQKDWKSLSGIKQILVRILTPEGNQKIEVSILTDDLTRDANEIIQLMLNRWIQENDFKYLIEHFGIDQITTYKSYQWETITNNVEDKMHESGQYKAITTEIENIRKRLKTALLKKHRYQKKFTAKSKKKPTAKQKASYQKTLSEIVQLTQQLENQENQRQQIKKLTSKNQDLIDQGYERLDTNVKLYMDTIKIIGRNIFYLSFQNFRKLYNNYRDDLLIFRKIICSPGLIKHGEDQLIIQLATEIELPQKSKKILAQIIDQINKTEPTLLFQNAPKITLELDSNIESFFAKLS